jgi:hypothetical protein
VDRGRLLAVSPVAEPGGAETPPLCPLRALAARGWSVTLTAADVVLLNVVERLIAPAVPV